MTGLELGQDQVVQDCAEVCEVQLCKGRYQKEGLLFDFQQDKAVAINQPFIFGKFEISIIVLIALSDAELEDKMENMPMIAVKVEEKDWIKYN